MSKTPEDMRIKDIHINIGLKLAEGASEMLFDSIEFQTYHDWYFLPENANDYDFLERIPINSSTDICAYICAAEAISNEYDTNVLSPFYYESDSDVADAYTIIPQLFLFCRKKLEFPELLDNIRTIQRKSNRDWGIVFEWISELEEISPEDYDSEELINTVMEKIEEVIDAKLFNRKAVMEISMPWPPIPIADIKSVEITCIKWNHRDYIDWYEDPDDVKEFKSDSETSIESENFKYLKTKWSVFQYEHIPFEYEEILDGSYDENISGCEYLLSVEEALQSGDINNLLPEWWYEKSEVKIIKSQNNSGFKITDDSFNDAGKTEQNVYNEFIKNSTLENLKKIYKKDLSEGRNALRYAAENNIKIVSSLEPLEFSPDTFLYFDCYDVYIFLKDCIDRSDAEAVGLLMSVLELPDEFMAFWHIGILHDAISSDSAEITANLLNSGKLRFTDGELEYLIDYAIESKKPEHTACLLNYKNDNKSVSNEEVNAVADLMSSINDLQSTLSEASSSASDALKNTKDFDALQEEVDNREAEREQHIRTVASEACQNGRDAAWLFFILRNDWALGLLNCTDDDFCEANQKYIPTMDKNTLLMRRQQAMPWLNDQNTYNIQIRMLYGTDFEQRYIMLVQNYLDRINPVNPWEYINNAFGWLRNFFTPEEQQLVWNRLCEENNYQKTYMLDQLSVLNPEFTSFENAKSYLTMQLEDPDPQKYDKSNPYNYLSGEAYCTVVLYDQAKMGMIVNLLPAQAWAWGVTIDDVYRAAIQNIRDQRSVKSDGNELIRRLLPQYLY